MDARLQHVLLKANADYKNVRFSVYRTALKLRKIQKSLKLDRIDAASALTVLSQPLEGLTASPDNSYPDIDAAGLKSVVCRVVSQAQSQLGDEEIFPEALAEIITAFILCIYDLKNSGVVSLQAVRTFFILMCNRDLAAKYRSLFWTHCEPGNKTLTKQNVAFLLNHTVQLTRVIFESNNYSNIGPAIESCFGGIFSYGISEHDFIRWLLLEPQSIVWLPTMHRIISAERSKHHVPCSICRTQPIVGLRFRCLRCLDYNACQNCFLTNTNRRRSHKPDHPVQEYCLPAGKIDGLRAFARTFRNIVTKRYKTKTFTRSFLPIDQSGNATGIMTESWTEQTLDVTSEQHGTTSKMDSHNAEELDTSRMSAGFADVSQLADEEKEKLEALIDRLEEERRRMIATTELLASTQTSEHAEGGGEKYEKGILRRELENVKHYNSDLERELDDLRQTMHPSPPPRTSTPFMPYASNSYHVQDPHGYPTPHHTHPKEAYGATGVQYVPEFKKPLISAGRDPDIRRIIDKYQPEKNGVHVLPSRPSPHQFGGSPSSQRSSPYMAPSPQGSPHQPNKSCGTHYPMIHREPHYERLKSGENPHLHGAGYPQSSPYLGDAQNGGQYHPTPTNRHRSHGSLGDIHAYQDTPIGYDEGVHDRSYKSQGNSPRSTRSRTPTRHMTSRRSGSRERATRPPGDHESSRQRDRSPHSSQESLNRDAQRSPKTLHVGYKNDESTADERPMSQEPHKKRGRSPHPRNTPPKQTHNGSPTTDRPHRRRGSKGPLSGKPNKPHAEEYWDQTATPETTPKTSQSSMTSASDVEHNRNRVGRSPASPTEKRNQKSRRSPTSQSSRSGEKSPKQSRRASDSPRPRKSRESPNAPHESLHRSDQRSHRSMDRDAPKSRERLSRGSPPVSQESLDRVGQRSHDRLAQSSSPYTSHESVNRRGQRSHDRLGKSSRDQLSSPEGSVRSGSSHGGRRRGSGARKERRPSHGSLVGPRKVVSCENLALAPGQSSHGSLDSVDTLHGGASNPSLESHGVYGTSNADTISPIPDTPRSFDPRREYTEEIDPYSQIHSSDHDITEKSCTDIEKAHSPIHTLKQSGTYLAPEVIQVHIQNEPPLQSSTLKSVSTSTDDSPAFQPKSTPKISDRVSKLRSKPSPGPDRSTTEVSSKSNTSDALKEQKPTPRRRAKQKVKKEQKDTDSSSSSSSRTEPEGNMEPKFIESFNTDESFETPEEEMKFLVSKLQGMMPTLLEEDGERVQSVELKSAKPMHEVFVAAEQTRKAIRRFAEYAIAVAAGEI